jgi:predicted GH43/DUF377 family glycosyl hydrolase
MTSECTPRAAQAHRSVLYLPANDAIRVERINGGEPVVAPDEKWAWGNDVRFNPSALYLSRGVANDAVIAALLGRDALSSPDTSDGVVVIHDRARPHEFPGLAQSRDFIGLTVFTPDYRLLKSFDEPVAYPSDDPAFSDHCGMQDPRITPIGDEFLMTYCGWNYVRPNDVHCNAMMAKSRDLLHWEKLGDIPGLERVNNKDHVLFCEPIHGKYFMLHRPMRPEDNGEHMTELAIADRPEGPYTTLGKIMDAFPEQYPMFACSKIGASAPPLPLGGNKWLVTYHYGHLVSHRMLHGSHDLYYTACVAIFDFDNFDPQHPERIVGRRLENIIVPETTWEMECYARHGVPKVVFLTGNYEYDGWIWFVYGASDTFVCVARTRRDELVDAIERHGQPNRPPR